MVLRLRDGGGDGSEARQDATNEAGTIWSADKDNVLVSRVGLPSAARGVRLTRPAGGCRVHRYVPQREWQEQGEAPACLRILQRSMAGYMASSKRRG